MKHIKPLTQKPAAAQQLGIGEILVIVAQILAVIAEALVIKDQPVSIPSGSTGTTTT